MSPRNCDLVRSAIAVGRRSARTTSHLLTCPECRAYRHSLLRIDSVARRLSNPVPPVFDDARFPVGRPTAGTRAPVDRRRFVVGAGAVAAAIALGCVIGPRFATPMLFAAEVRTAIAHANTWHFTGWKLDGKQRVKWEIWGRRTPFFYREQIGDSLLIATDKSRFQIVAPDRHRPRGLAITTLASAYDPKKSLSNGPESFIEGIGGEFIGRLHPAGQDANTTTLRSPINHTAGVARLDDQGVLTVDRQSKLPVKYTLQRAIHADETVAQMETRGLSMPVIKTVEIGELAATYNVSIPAEAVAAATPAGYASVDLRQTPAKNNLALSEAGTASTSGITVRANVISRDADGNLHVRFDGWFGAQAVTPDLPCFLGVHPMGEGIKFALRGGPEASDKGKTIADLSRSGRILEASRQMAITDSNGTGYIEVQNPVGEIDGVHPEWYLVPVEPLAAGRQRPTSLTASASVEATWYEYLPEARTGVTHALANGVVNVPVPLPAATTALDYDTRPIPHGIRMMDGRVPLNIAAALARAQHYIGEIDKNVGSTGQLKQHNDAEMLARAKFWADQARTSAQALTGGTPQAVRIQLSSIDSGLDAAQGRMSRQGE